jgi:protein-tyrosine phosphatase
MGKPPRMIKLNSGWNVRDIGGWNADGGKVRFGLLFRGARLENATTDDLTLLASEGVKLDLDLRDASNASGSTRIPGASYYNAALTNAYTEMI